MRKIDNLGINVVCIRDKQETMRTGITDSSERTPRRMSARINNDLNQKVTAISIELNVNTTEIIRALVNAFTDAYERKMK